ncbi:late competence protein (DNA binding and uptake) [Oceanobacillus iheyensis HTE831]|uniref:Late competence protein (DNA binding and uptake) n=1 Tax=Oceanobacillus iheyensis (strain DSM 14371 / CIP 107618 / JCM 11309 / KCTC 3954 / HTE831) TaxID=221109 RepID=Q8EPV5_OCEIH|nr:helix-hairpin-helix domain-containing protein [Oceanobacillus iheyensis]BAC13937.1 late competence protein (DNA binding and uptake) [Oceanobacillus iheyensis HTE831]
MLNLLKKSSFFLLAGLAVFFFVVFTKKQDSSAELPIDTKDTDELFQDDTNSESTVDNEQSLVVDVKGAVQSPGVYTVEQDDRIHDVIELAGGFSKNADQSQVNLAQLVQDEMIIAVPEQGEQETNISSGINDSNDKIRINYASVQEIEQLPGIGPSKAETIFQYREENGLFRELEDLLNISGIGEKTIESLRDYIQIP